MYVGIDGTKIIVASVDVEGLVGTEGDVGEKGLEGKVGTDGDGNDALKVYWHCPPTSKVLLPPAGKYHDQH